MGTATLPQCQGAATPGLHFDLAQNTDLSNGFHSPWHKAEIPQAAT